MEDGRVDVGRLQHLDLHAAEQRDDGDRYPRGYGEEESNLKQNKHEFRKIAHIKSSVVCAHPQTPSGKLDLMRSSLGGAPCRVRRRRHRFLHYGYHEEGEDENRRHEAPQDLPVWTGSEIVILCS